MIKNLVNFLTVSRIILAVIIFFSLVSSNYLLCLFLFFLAGASDYFDGYIARKYKAQSVVGEILDPMADKILIVFLFFGLAVHFSSFFIGFLSSGIIARELWVAALRDFNSRQENHEATKVIFLAKIKTSIQLFTISLYLLGLTINSMLMIVISDIFLVMSFLITIYTGYLYTKNSFK